MGARKLEKYLTRQLEEHVSRASVEREQKYRVSNIERIRARLIRLGAQAHASGFERNELFDCGERLRNLGLKLRLRRHGGKVTMLTLKGPRLGGYHKTRMEVETPVEYEPAKRILELLQFRVIEAYSKVREEYRLEGCPVCLDHISNLGWFVEIEGPAGKIREIARKLGLKGVDREPRSYRRLIKEAALLSLRSAHGMNGNSVHEITNR
jgi:predicted adenylyl cyclase CyaB